MPVRPEIRRRATPNAPLERHVETLEQDRDDHEYRIRQLEAVVPTTPFVLPPFPYMVLSRNSGDATQTFTDNVEDPVEFYHWDTNAEAGPYFEAMEDSSTPATTFATEIAVKEPGVYAVSWRLDWDPNAIFPGTAPVPYYLRSNFVTDGVDFFWAVAHKQETDSEDSRPYGAQLATWVVPNSGNAASRVTLVAWQNSGGPFSFDSQAQLQIFRVGDVGTNIIAP